MESSKPTYDPNAPPLTREEMKNALDSGMVRRFPKVARHKYDPPVANQSHVNLSFMLLKEPYDGVVGFVKVRGTWADEDTCSNKAEDIIRNVDSTSVVHIGPVGYWVPVTNNERFSKDQMDVKMQETDIALRDKAAKDADNKQKQQQREIQERKEELKSRAADDDSTYGTLDYYTKKKVTSAELGKYIRSGEEKLASLRKSQKGLEDEIATMDAKFDHCKKWLDNYNEARKKVGLPPLSEKDLNEPIIVGNVDENLYQ